MQVHLAESDSAITRCAPVMRQLRPHIHENGFVARVRVQQAGGYLLAYLEDAGQVVAVTGFRILENLYSGRVLYVDDLVTDDAARSRGHGTHLLDWLVARAREEGCQTLELDSGVQRFAAHRFYLTNRMDIVGHHFRLML